MTDSAPTHEIMRGIRITCERGHTQQIYTPNHDVKAAQLLAGLLDGTSPLFVALPRTHPIIGSTIGRCDLCGAWLACMLFGYDEESTP
jgi:hypothetical protein